MVTLVNTECECSELAIGLDEVAYVGDDVNDLPVIQAVGLSACPADATAPVLAACEVVLTKIGGEGCVREFLDRFLTHN